MIHLTREIRFSLNGESSLPKTNSWAGWPPPKQISPYLMLRVTMSGEIDPTSGYLCNVKEIDDAVRQQVVVPSCERKGSMVAESLVSSAYQELNSAFGSDNFSVSRVELLVNPFLTYTINSKDIGMVLITQQFEFSASHRLHNEQLSDDQNSALYGKCNNPLGHGHNYVVDVTVSGPQPGSENTLSIGQLEAVVKNNVIDPLDHKYLNCEVEEFRDSNPSVENIAIVIWKMLDGKLEPAKLERIRVYETPKTWAEYAGT